MKLGYNEIMIVSMYFNDINDFINLEMGVKRFQGNIERFHFNPIPLNEYSRKLFPNIETFHIYNEEDEIFDDGKIFKKVIWYTVNYSTYLKEKEQGNICKNIEYTEEDRKKYGNTIPSEVKSLGDYCFNNCDSLTSIDIPSSVSKIGADCFIGCTSLRSINIPSSVSFIGYGCFLGRSSLTSMNIDNLQFISKERIFMNEPVLVSIEIPKNLEIINGKNIEKKDINEFIIPSSITKLGEYCFYQCSSLTSINIPTSINEIGIYCFYECCSLISINIPSSISKLGICCFKECYSLKSINIPASVSEIGDYCFDGCSSLTSVSVDNLQFISKERIFMNEPVLVSIKIPENLQIINGKNIEKKDINEFIIPTTITKLGDWCFYEYSSLISINIPSTINELGDDCFCECYSLTSINIPSSISKIGYECFYNCSSLTSINIPSSITSFGRGCFYGCGCEEELMKNETIPTDCFK
ncbi:hypothetical protein EDI_090620 [Entamoeba dispar SAW760]|uniref:Leucine rich repeat containing protein BspA family protein n=1 Tax=Entamoeba dispar (strain ATCC PRA-260 / SAW760) TaxID=370354 RepID=B0ESF0_ENTDS|nr:uncharacterized protein EDI_090620 [Entamoeba dispar SAW760]EDR22546.1 hypothetical protein EDI_090620 [Entamoeba dispar SAW760]|eukprot:EDR22546.1 hypothetical protein EDI_090620 [Entamoeba dispar SAW760]